MLPFSKKALKYQIRRNATTKGLFGGNKLWLAVFVLQRLGGLKNKFTKGGEMPVVVSDDLEQGGVFAIIHNPPAPTRRSRKKAAKAEAKAAKVSSISLVNPSKRKAKKQTKKVAKANKKVAKRTKKVNKRLVKPTVVEVGLDR